MGEKKLGGEWSRITFPPDSVFAGLFPLLSGCSLIQLLSLDSSHLVTIITSFYCLPWDTKWCVCAQVLSQCSTLCDLMDYSLPGSSVHWVLQARILKQVAISYSRGSSQARDQTQISCISCIGRWILYLCIIWEAKALDYLLIWLTFAFTFEIVPALNYL